jgi:Fe-S cluster assembly protein SufD
MSTTIVERASRFVPGFGEAEFRALPAEASAVLRAKREEAFRVYAETPAPTARDEEWRRTDPALIPFDQSRRLPDLQPADVAKADRWDDQFDVVVAIGDRTFTVTDRSGITRGGGCSVLPLRDAAATRRDLVEEHLQGAALPGHPRKFELLNAAFWNVGVLIHVAAKTSVPKGILLRYDPGAAGGALIPRLVVVAEDQSEVSLVEHFTSPDGVSSLCLGAREFYAGQGARLKLVSVQEWGDRACHIGEDWARVGRDGRIDWVTLTLGGKVSKMMVGSDVCEPNANAYLSGVFFAEGDQHFDQRTLQLHSAPDTYSNLLYKGAVKDRGHSVYQGVINAKPGAIRVDAYQMNNNLILNEGARADSLPGLEIDADDLKCSHGATMGALDPEQVFYLRSRGLGETEARRLVVGGFFEDVIAKVPYEFVQERLREHIERKMGSA